MNSKMLLRSTVLAALLTLFFQKQTKACGYAYVSDCATILDISVDGITSGFHASSCPYLNVFHGHDFGSVTSLSVTNLKSITWESCDNYVMNARFHYRIYELGSSPGAFSQIELSQQSIITNGPYRTRTREETITTDLLEGLNHGTYAVDIYFDSEVDFDNDGAVDDIISKNNGGNYYQAVFTIPSGQSGVLDVVLVNSTNPACHGQNTGSAVVSTNNGSPPYSYLWSNGTAGAAVTGLSAGAYSVTSTDNDGNTGTLNVLISQPTSISVNISGEDETSPSANNGSANATPTGGTPPFSFLWSDGETTPNISDLDSGVYGLTISDHAGCTGSGTVIISVSGSNPTNYCASKGDFPWVDWITNVQIADLDHPSGKSQYSDFTSESTALNLGANYSITLENGFSWQTYDEYWKVWIDYDRDGNFEEPEEVAFSGILSAPPLGTSVATVTGSVNVPSSAEEGITRMRVSLRRGGYAQPCETIPYGEVEDYTINLVNNGPVPCDISSSIGNLTCNDNGTNLDPSDDTFTFDLNVNGSGTGTHWETNINGQSYSGNYGSPVELGPFDISGGAFSFTISDANDADCTTTQTATPPAPCSNNNPCTIVVNSSTPNCNDNGTPADPSDDTYTFFLTVTGDNTGTGWQATIAGQAQTGSYGISKLMGPYAISGGNLSFFVEDQEDLSCTTYTAVDVPVPCSNGGGGTSYCATQGSFPWHDWITGVTFENLDNSSQKSAYSDFTGLTANVVAGQTYTIDLTSGFSWYTYDEYWKVWIDFNQDGTFSGSDELVFSTLEPAPPNGTLDHTLSGTIEIPADAMGGATRMRVVMSREDEPVPCGNFAFGEAEDYTVVINPNQGGGNSSNIVVDAHAGLEDITVYALLEIPLGAKNWLLEKSSDGRIFELFDSGEIGLGQKTMGFQQIDYTPSEGPNIYRLSLLDENNRTLSEKSTSENFVPLTAFQVLPNPTYGPAKVELSEVQGLDVQIKVSTSLGQPIYQFQFSQTDVLFHPLPTESWRDGFYLVTVIAENRRPITKRLVIQR